MDTAQWHVDIRDKMNKEDREGFCKGPLVTVESTSMAHICKGVAVNDIIRCFQREDCMIMDSTCFHPCPHMSMEGLNYFCQKKKRIQKTHSFSHIFMKRKNKEPDF